MRPARLAPVVLTFVTAAWGPAAALGGGFGGGAPKKQDRPPVFEFKPARLPLSSRAARAWLALHETKVKLAFEPMALRDALQLCMEAAQGKDRAKAPPFRFYVDPIGLQEAEKTLDSPVEASVLSADPVSLHTFLGYALKSVGLTHRVRDGLVVIEADGGEDDEAPPPYAPTAAEARTWLILSEDVPLRYPEETPLFDVLRAVQKATAAKGPDGKGLVLHINPVGLQEAEKTIASPVRIEADDLPLATALRLTLRQLGLRFHVREDGVVEVTSETDEGLEGDILADQADTAEAYQRLRFEQFHERLRQRAEMMGRMYSGPMPAPNNPQPGQNPGGGMGGMGGGMR